jgi:glycosyltransferase involved in cell wall biosynthesis
VIVGDGRLRHELESQAKQLGLSQVVIFTGERSDIPRLLQAMTMFVMPSLYEGCQYSLLEAMAMARPVVSTPAGVAPIVVQHRSTGLIVPFADASALARAVLELLADEELAVRLGTAGRQMMAREFSLNSMIDRLVRVYAEAVAHHSGVPR